MNGLDIILLIDDVVMNLELLERALTAQGYRVVTADSGDQALAIAAKMPPALILLDILMPDMDGYETCRRFKSQPQLRDVPVIFISALNETIDKLKGFEVGAVDYLTKPFHLEEVLVRVKTHLTLQQQRKQIELLLRQRELAESAERQQRIALDTLLSSAITLGSTLNLDEVLERILQDVGEVVPHDLALIILVEDQDGWVANVQSALPFRARSPATRFKVRDFPVFEMMRQTHRIAIMPDIDAAALGIELSGPAVLRSFIGAPIFDGDKLSGILCLLAVPTSFYGERASQRLQAFTVLAEFAIKNARLYERAQELGIVQERQRLARELHDSISQTLFSANALAEVLPRIIDSNPAKARSYMNELAQYTREAMAEMRTLLFELRPDALKNTELSLLIRQLCDMFTLKTRISVEFLVRDEFRLPAVKQVAFYRVAQAALNLIAHDGLAGVTLELALCADGAEMRIHCNGAFQERDFAAHLESMRDYADSIAAQLTVTSNQGHGMQIVLREHSDDRPYPNRSR